MRVLVLLLAIALGGCGESVRRDMRRAVRLLQEGEFAASEKTLRGVLRADSDAVLVHQTLGALFFAKAQFDSALHHCRAAIRLDGELAPAHHTLGLIHTYGRRYDEAERYFQKALDLDPGHPAYHYNTGILYDYLGRLREAGGRFAAVLRIDPMNQQAHRYLASILQRQNRHREALKHYFVSVQLNPSDAKSWHGIGRLQTQLKEDSLAVAAFEQAVALDTSYAEAVYNLSLAYRKIGRLREAQSAMERARFLRGEGDKNERQAQLMTTHPDLALDQYGLGKLYESRGWSAMARARFYRARRLGLRDEEMEQALPQSGPDPSLVERLAGSEAMRHKEYAMAVAHYRVAVRLAPENARNYRNMGLALVSQERPEEALTAYREAMQLDSGLAAAHSDLALLYSKNFSQHLKAIELLDKALELEPRNKLYWYNLAHIYLTLGQYDEAAERFERVLDFDPHSALTLYSLGLALAKHGSHQAALDRLQQAVEINPQYEDAHYQLGTVYRALGRLDEAAAAYERCLSFNPNHRYASYGLGQVYMQLGQREAAQVHLERFQRLPDHRPEPQYMQYLFYTPPDTT